MSDLSGAFDIIDSAVGQPPAGAVPVAAPSDVAGADDHSTLTIHRADTPAPKSTAESAMDVIDAGINKSLPDAPASKKYPGTTPMSAAMNVAAGTNEAVSSTLGAPVDLVNKAAGIVANAPSQIAARVKNIYNDFAGGEHVDVPPVLSSPGLVPNPVGGSQWIKDQQAKVGASPDQVAPPQNELERALRAGGSGVASAVMPAGIVGVLKRAGTLAGPALETAETMAGPSTTGGTAANATLGATSGMAGQVASDAVPEPYKPLIGTLASLGAGVATAGAMAVPGAIGAAARKVSEPLSAAGQKAIADRALIGGTENPDTALQALRDHAENVAQNGELVPGSKPTTFQVSGDMGQGAMEREAETASPGQFNARRSEQNAARVGAIEGIQKTGDPSAVSAHIRDTLEKIDSDTAKDVRNATTAAQAKAGAIGGEGTPESYGEGMRASLESANGAAKTKERELWKSVDPDGTLALPSGPITKAAEDTIGKIGPNAKPMDGEEKAIFDIAANQPPVMKFGDLTDLRSRVSAEMRVQSGQNGNPVALGRLTKLRGAIEDAIDNAAAHKAASDQASLKSRLVSNDKPSESDVSGVRARAASVSNGAAPSSGGTPSGGSSGQGNGRSGNDAVGQTVPGTIARSNGQSPGEISKVYYPSGNLGVRYEVADLPSLVTSHDTNFRVNPKFPQELQPRNRETAPAQDQVNSIAARLEPERLGQSPEANSGAPIVGPDHVVESGNGRTLALAKVYEQGRGGDYRNWLESQGYDTSGMKQPVLIARRTTPMTDAERVAFAHSANSSSGLRMNAAEQAAADAKLMSDITSPEVGGIGSVENRPFIRSFLSKIPVSERGGLLDSEGSLSQNGVKRVESALAFHAYGDGAFVSKAFDEADPNIKGLAGAMVDAAPAWAKMRAAAREGTIEGEHDVTPDLMNTVRSVIRARDSGVPISEVLNQGDMFGGESSSLAKSLLMKDDGSGLASRAQIADRLKTYAEESQKNLAGPNLLGDKVAASDVMKASLAKSRETVGNETTVPQEPPSVSKAMQPAHPDVKWDENAAERLKDASAATADRKQTFGKGAVGDTLATTGTKGNYRILDSQVGQKFWKPGPTGAEAVGKFTEATGNKAEALSDLTNYAALSLRKKAMNADGTIDPDKFAQWSAAHADALRAVPAEVRAKFADASTAGEAVANATSARKAALDSYQKGVLGKKFLNVSEPGDVTKAVGAMFGKVGSIQNMRQLASEVATNPEARDGLRKAIVEHMTNSFVSNREAGTTGVNAIKGDGLQTFVRQNKPVLAQVFSKDEIKGMEAVAADLARANRSIDALKLPARSNSPQDLIGAIKGSKSAHLSPMTEIMAAMAAGYEGLGVKGAIMAGAAAAGHGVYNAMKSVGADKIQGLVNEMLLNPQLARASLERSMANTSPQGMKAVWNRFGSQLNRVATISANRLVNQTAR